MRCSPRSASRAVSAGGTGVRRRSGTTSTCTTRSTISWARDSSPSSATRICTECALAADLEAGLDPGPRIRDLATNELVPAVSRLDAARACRARFSPERWEAFRSDTDWLRARARAARMAADPRGSRLQRLARVVARRRTPRARARWRGRAAVARARRSQCSSPPWGSASRGRSAGGRRPSQPCSGARTAWRAGTGPAARCCARIGWSRSSSASRACAAGDRRSPARCSRRRPCCASSPRSSSPACSRHRLSRRCASARSRHCAASRAFAAGGLVATALLVSLATAQAGPEAWRGFVSNSRKLLETPLLQPHGPRLRPRLRARHECASRRAERGCRALRGMEAGAARAPGRAPLDPGGDPARVVRTLRDGRARPTGLDRRRARDRRDSARDAC